MKVAIHAAKTNLSKLIERACAGEEVIISRGKTPVVQLLPIATVATKRTFGAMKGRAKTSPAFFESLPQEELAAWEE